MLARSGTTRAPPGRDSGTWRNPCSRSVCVKGAKKPGKSPVRYFNAIPDKTLPGGTQLRTLPFAELVTLTR